MITLPEKRDRNRNTPVGQWLLASFFIAILLTSCGGSPKAGTADGGGRSPSGTTEDAAWNHRRWLDKTVRLLRAGEGLSASDDVGKWLADPREKVVADLMADPRFADMVLAFNMYFLGIPMDEVRQENGEYHENVYMLPQAISGARAMLGQGDYFSLFDLYQPPYYGPLPPVLIRTPSEKRTANEVLRRSHFSKIQHELGELLAAASKPSPPALADLCTTFRKRADQRMLDDLLGLPRYFVGGFMMGAHWYGAVLSLCDSASASPTQFAAAVGEVIQKNERLMRKLDALEPIGRRPADVGKIPVIDISDLDPDYRFNTFLFLQRGTLVNTNTNLNRKRAGYLLKHYFCDNMTPVSVEIPAQHASDRHASDPACMSCHYKLDPMAGFLRNYGRGFEDFTGKPFIIFDDKVQGKLSDYVKNWQSSSPDRKWDVGFIRSVTNEKSNSYGETPEDLFHLFRQAPETRRCIVQRMYEFLVSDSQAVDDDYLDYLTEQFNADAATDSKKAVKNLISRIVLSEGYGTPSRDPARCYDYRPGYQPSVDTPPCQVASILQHNCVSCHHSVQDPPYLDLKHYQRLPDGSLGFPHLTEGGAPIAARATLRQIADRLMDTDPEIRMPYRAEMSNTDRQALYFWSSTEEAK